MNHKRILIVEDDPEYALIAHTVLADCDESFEVRTAITLAEGFDLLSQFKPHVVLLDLDLPDSTGYETFLRVKGRAEETPIIVLTSLDDDRTALKTAENGAHDYLVKGLQQPKLIARCVNMVLRRHARAVSPAPSQTIGFIGSKGGVGTSTIAVNAAAHLGQSGIDTLLIEFQPGPGSLSIYLPAKPSFGLSSLLEIPRERIAAMDLHRAAMQTGRDLRILCSGPYKGPSAPVNAEYAHTILSAARDMANYLVLDLPSRVDGGVAAALNLCDSVAVIVDREISSVRSAAEMLEQLRAAGIDEGRTRVVAVDRRNPDVSLSLADIFTQLKMRPVFAIPYAAASISLAQSAKTPLTWLYPQDPFSSAIDDLTEQLVPSARPSKSTANQGNFNSDRSPVLVPDTFFG